MKKTCVDLGSIALNKIKAVPQIDSRTKMRDVGCDRIIWSITSNLFLIKLNSNLNGWSFGQGQKTIKPISEEFQL